MISLKSIESIIRLNYNERVMNATEIHEDYALINQKKTVPSGSQLQVTSIVKVTTAGNLEYCLRFFNKDMVSVYFIFYLKNRGAIQD